MMRSQRTTLAGICERHGVLLLTAFGSATRPDGEPRDLDLAVLFDRRLTHRDALGLVDDLTALTGLQDLDVMGLNTAGPVARERALVGSIVLYEAVHGLLANEQIAAMLERMDTEWLRRAAIEGMAR